MVLLWVFRALLVSVVVCADNSNQLYFSYLVDLLKVMAARDKCGKDVPACPLLWHMRCPSALPLTHTAAWNSMLRLQVA